MSHGTETILLFIFVPNLFPIWFFIWLEFMEKAETKKQALLLILGMPLFLFWWVAIVLAAFHTTYEWFAGLE